jgi:hypothetical protein
MKLSALKDLVIVLLMLGGVAFAGVKLAGDLPEAVGVMRTQRVRYAPLGAAALHPSAVATTGSCPTADMN